MRSAPSLARRLRDSSGASIVIALVFFLICGIIGSVVVTAASVQAKSVHTHKELQQSEYTMQSAAELIAQQLGGEDSSALQHSVTVHVSYGTDKKPIVDVSKVHSEVGKGFWTKGRTESILANRAAGSSYVLGDSPSNRLVVNSPSGSQSMDPVYGKITVDADMNMTVELSLDPELSPSSPYNMTVFIQCTPTYNAAGQLTSFTYGDGTTIKKTSGSAS